MDKVQNPVILSSSISFLECSVFIGLLILKIMFNKNEPKVTNGISLFRNFSNVIDFPKSNNAVVSVPARWFTFRRRIPRMCDTCAVDFVHCSFYHLPILFERFNYKHFVVQQVHPDSFHTRETSTY
jgi:hypothetical protein